MSKYFLSCGPIPEGPYTTSERHLPHSSVNIDSQEARWQLHHTGMFSKDFFPLLPKSTGFHIVSDLTNSCARRVVRQSFRGLWRLCWANYLLIKVQENTDKYLIYFLVVGGTNREQKKEKPWFVTSACFDSVNIPVVANCNLLWSHWMGNFEEMAPRVPVSWDSCLSHTNDVIPPGTMPSNRSLAHFSVLFSSIS